ncbi:caspase family protein [Dyadobacter sp. 32]|uniref:caspase family protein n=1 Tax=Dyadobacter sp. 32 TaxID=538966 RepID=UPI0011EC5FA1
MANSNNYAFIVGIDDYPGFSNLKGARKDAEAFWGWITTVGEVEENNCVKLLSSIDPAPPRPTQYDIDHKLNDLMDTARAAQEMGNAPNRLYFYFSGHGLGLDTTDVGLCLPYWSRALKGDNLSTNSYLETLKKSGLFKEIIVFLDCCRVRDTNVIGRPPFLTVLAPAQNAPKVKSMVFYAAEYLSPSFEAKSNNGDQVRGFFTTALLDGLSGGAAVANGQVTYKSLLNYLAREVPRRSKQRQKPRCLNEFLPADFDQAFLKATREPVKYTYSDDVFVLKVTVPQGDPNFQSVTVYDIFNEEKAVPKQSSFKLPLFGGKYFVVSEFTDSCITEEVDLLANFEHSIGLTSIMVAPNDHEYQCYPAQNASQNPTKICGDNANAGLLIFIRYENREAVDPSISMNAYLELRDEQAVVITRFAEEDLYHENNDKTLYLKDGYLNYSIKAPAGLYYLVYSGEPKRQMPLYLFDNRQTQLFMLFSKAPIFDSARIYLAGWDGFQAYNTQDSIENKIDAATRFLQNAHGSVPVGLLDDLFNGKFQEPMRGLLAAYILLKGRAEKADFYNEFFDKEHPELVERKEDYFRIVVPNLSNLLGANSPDVKAIKLMTTDFMEDFKNETFQFTQPPLFSFGLREVIRRASLDPSILPAGSLLIQIAPKLKTDSVFSSWEALAAFQPETIFCESTKDLSENPDLDASLINSIYQLTIAEYRKNSKEAVKKGFDKEVAQTLALPVQTVRAYMTAMSATNKMNDEQREYFQLSVEDFNGITSTISQFPALLQSPKLSDITGLKFLEQQKLKKAGIHDLGSLIQIGADVNRFDTLVSQIKTTGDTLTSWITQAKKLVE